MASHEALLAVDDDDLLTLSLSKIMDEAHHNTS